LGYSEPSSPDFYNGNGYFSDVPIQQSQASFPLMNNGPPPAIAPDPLSKSIESPPKTLQAQTLSPVEGGINVQVKPAALVSKTLRSRPSMGPRTVSHTEGFRRPSDSPMSSPMRRIVSAGGNRNIISGHVIKSRVESIQRPLINLGGFGDTKSLLKHNYHNIHNPPSLTTGSSLSSSFVPPTPTSPQEREITFVKRENPRSTISPIKGGINYFFNAGVPSCFTIIERDQNLASPPETLQAQIDIHSSGNGWPTGVEFHEKQWQFEVPDEPLYTPAHDTFNLELQMFQRTLHNVQASCDLQVPPSSVPYQVHRIDAAARNRDVLSRWIRRPDTESQDHSTPSARTFCLAHTDAASFMEHRYPNFETMPPLTTAPSVNSIVSPPTPMEPHPEWVAPHFTAEMRKPKVLDDILNDSWIHDLKSQPEGDEVVPNLSNETERNSKRAGSLARTEVANTCGESLHAPSVAHSARVKVTAAETFPVEVTFERLKPTWKPPTSISKEQENHLIDSDNIDQVPIKLEGGTGMEADDKDEELSREDNCVFKGPGTEQIDSPYEQGISKPRSALDFHNEEYDSVLLSILEDMCQALVEHVMDEFWFIYAQEWTTGTSGNSPMSPNRNQDFRKPESIAPCQTFQRKRERDDEEDQPDGNGDKKRRQPRDRSGPSSNSHRRGRFACPFRKYDCQKYSVYSHRVCALTSWDTIARVK
jgi:hypothetical protein